MKVEEGVRDGDHELAHRRMDRRFLSCSFGTGLSLHSVSTHGGVAHAPASALVFVLVVSVGWLAAMLLALGGAG